MKNHYLSPDYISLDWNFSWKLVKTGVIQISPWRLKIWNFLKYNFSSYSFYHFQRKRVKTLNLYTIIYLQRFKKFGERPMPKSPYILNKTTYNHEILQHLPYMFILKFSKLQVWALSVCRRKHRGWCKFSSPFGIGLRLRIVWTLMFLSSGNDRGRRRYLSIMVHFLICIWGSKIWRQISNEFKNERT